MFKYNEPCETITGEIVTPYTKEGKLIACFDRNGKTVYKTIKDFSDKKQNKTIEAIPVQKEEIKQGFIADNVFKQYEELKKEKIQVKEEPVVEKPKKERKPRKKKEKIEAEQKPIKETKKRNIETDTIKKKDTWKSEFNLNYKDNIIEEE